MTFDDVVNESTIEYVEKAQEKRAVKRCWCGGATARSEVDLGIVCLESIYHNPVDEGRPVKVNRLYIAGPMTGYSESNYPAFNAVADALRSVGYEVVNPAEFGNDNGRTSYVDLLRNDLRALLDCDGVAALDNWWESVGARNEIQVAGTLKMPVRSTREWVEMKG